MGTLLIKEIKPTTLRVATFRLAWLNALRQAGRDIIKDFRKITDDWETDVVFEMQISLSGGLQVEVFTTNPIFGYVDKGTKPHKIRAKNAPFLVFNWGGPGSYKPKTTPGVIGSTSSSQSGGVVAFKSVNHPGNAPRGFTEEIQKQWETKFKRRMEKALKQARLASGHAI